MKIKIKWYNLNNLYFSASRGTGLQGARVHREHAGRDFSVLHIVHLSDVFLR